MKKIHNPEEDFEELIIRFLHKETSAAEIAVLEEWLKEDADHRRVFRKINEAYQNQAHSHQGYRGIDDAWHQLSEKIHVAEITDEVITKTGRIHDFRWLKVAASVATLLLASFGIWQYFNNPTEQTQLTITTRADNAKRKLILPDGTTVWLNTNSSIQYAADFGKKGRTVILEGEAFFDVTKTGTTFVVRAKNLEVIVKGTRFNVNTLKESEAESATLEEGSVELKVKGRNKPIKMKPGQQISYNRGSKRIIVRNVNPWSYSSWKEAPLRFEKASLATIIEKIQARYKVVIKVDPAIAARENLSMTIQDETLDEVLELISISSSLRYEINGKEVAILE